MQKQGAWKENTDYRNLSQKADTVFLEVGSGDYVFAWTLE